MIAKSRPIEKPKLHSPLISRIKRLATNKYWFSACMFFKNCLLVPFIKRLCIRSTSFGFTDRLRHLVIAVEKKSPSSSSCHSRVSQFSTSSTTSVRAASLDPKIRSKLSLKVSSGTETWILIKSVGMGYYLNMKGLISKYDSMLPDLVLKANKKPRCICIRID